MPFELWGTTDSIALFRPDTAGAYFMLLLYVVGAIGLVWLGRDGFSRMDKRRWAIFAALGLLAFVFSQLFPLQVSFDRFPFTIADGSVLVLLTAVALLLGGLLLPPVVALLVGMLTGLGWALGDSQLPFDIFYFGFAGWSAAVLLQQNYTGRLYGALRNPIGAAVSAFLLVDLLLLLTAFGSNIGLGALSALDIALFTAGTRFWPLLIEAVIGGAIVWLLLLMMPQLRPTEPLVASNAQRTVRGYLLRNFLLFAVAILVINIAVVFFLTIYMTTQLVVEQMAYNANAVSADLVDLQQSVQLGLVGLGDDGTLASADGTTRARMLRQMASTSLATSAVLLVESDGSISSTFNETGGLAELTADEAAAVESVLTRGGSATVAASPPQPDLALSLVVSVGEGPNGARTALVGRLPQAAITDLLTRLPLANDSGLNFVVDKANQIVAQTSAVGWLLTSWQNLTEAVQRELAIDSDLGGRAYLVQSPAQTRELVYAAPPTPQGWTVVSAVAYSMVLQQALRIGLPLALLLGLVAAVFYARLANFGQELTRPITDLAEASRTIAAGGSLTTDVRSDRNDEIGRLSRSFDQMQRALKQRLDDLSLLLSVSQDVSTSVKLNESMPVILQGMLRATTATGARAVVLNPSGGYPLTFGEGPRAEAMAIFDQSLMAQMRHEGVLELETAAKIQQALGLDAAGNLPVGALFALPLQSDSNFQGVVFLGYSQPQLFDSAERNLLHTLASQAGVVVDNAHLFIKAEGGRRRLAAVLASTTDAVIVTDQTERVLLLNRAMEHAFGLNAKQVLNRPVSAVVTSLELVNALTNNETSTRNLELQGQDRNTYYANVSKIVSHDGQVLGRVAVLHDITHLKEADKMKSEFVATVSHDLRSPLTFMRGYATMIPMVGALNEVQEEYNQKILTGIEQMSGLVDDLLDLGKIEAGVELRFTEISLAELLNDVADDHISHVQQVGNRLELEIAPNLPLVKGDMRLLRQALTNLLMNSCKYAPNSGSITLGAAQLGNEVILHVGDHGPGIAKQDQMQLFEKFYRVQRAGTERIKGSGLGLAIVKSIAERHGGEAWCASQLGKGSTFYMSLPVE